MRNCLSINLKRNELVIRIKDDAKYEDILESFRKKIPELKKLYQDILSLIPPHFI